MQNFSIVIPTLNEADNILPLLEQIHDVIKLREMHPEIIFIDDGSTDNTRQTILDYSGELDVRLIARDGERGLASAVVAGAQAAGNEHILVMDADLSHPPEAIPALLEPLAMSTHDMVIGSRYVDGGETPDWPASRSIGSKVASLPARILTSTRDPLAGFFAVHRKHLAAVGQGVGGFKIGLEVLAGTADPLRVAEVPISFKDRSCGQSKMNVSVLNQYLLQLHRLFGENSTARKLPILLILGITAAGLDATMFSKLFSRGVSFETCHIASMMFAMHSCYLLTSFTRGLTPSRRPGKYFRFLILVILALFLRGGLLAMLPHGLNQNSSSFLLSLGLTSGVSWLAAILSLEIGILAKPFTANWKVFGILLTCYSILLRLVYLGNAELIQEEAYYWNYAQHLAAGYLDHPPMVAVLIRLGTLLFGDTELGVRIGAFGCWFITAVYCHGLANMIFNRDIAVKTVSLVALLPVFFGVGLVTTPDAPLMACWAAALYYLYKALVQQQSRAWFGAGIFLGLGLASKYTMVFLGPAVICFMLLDTRARSWFLRPQPYLAALLAVVIFSPVIWWNYTNEWASFLFQSKGRLQAVSEFSTDELLLSILLLLTPTGLIAVIAGMRPHFAAWADNGGGGKKNRQHDYLFSLIMAAIPLSIILVFSFTKEVKLNWTGPLWLAVLPFMAYTMFHPKGQKAPLLCSLWPKTLITLTICYGLVLHYCALGLPGLHYDDNNFLFGWDDLAQQVEKTVENITSQQGERPLVVGMDLYKTASGLAFYRYKNLSDPGSKPVLAETTGSHLFGHKSVMYSYWHSPLQAAERNILVVSHDKERLRPAYFTHHYHRLGEIQEFTVEKRGKKAGDYYYRLLKWYTPGTQGSLTSR